MKITVRRSDQDAFDLELGTVRVTLTGGELKVLADQVTSALEDGALSPLEVFRRLTDQIKAADDLGIQALIRRVDEDDVLVLLKMGERDADLCAKLYGNLSDRSRKMFREDLAFKFKEGISKAQASLALARIGRAIGALRAEGLLVAGNGKGGT